MEEVSTAVVCDVCGGIFKSQAGMASHKRSAHTEAVDPQPVKVEVKQEVNVVSSNETIFKSFLRVSLVDKVHKDVFDQLVAYPFVRTYVPRGQGEPKNATEFVGHNGLLMEIPKGVYVNLPEPIVDALNSSNNVSEYIKDYEITETNKFGKHI